VEKETVLKLAETRICPGRNKSLGYLCFWHNSI